MSSQETISPLAFCLEGRLISVDDVVQIRRTDGFVSHLQTIYGG